MSNFEYDTKALSVYLKLSAVFSKMSSKETKDLIESFGFFYNESKFGPSCNHTKKTYSLLHNNKDMKKILIALKEIGEEINVSRISSK